MSRTRPIPIGGEAEKREQSQGRKGRSALLSSAPRGENSGLLQTLRPKLSLQSELSGDEVFGFVFCPQMAFYQWLSSSPASLDIKRRAEH